MHLKMYREHYTSKDNKVWYPKRGFVSEEDIEEQVGFNPAKCNIYRCTFCNMLHMGRHQRKSRVFNDNNR